MLSQGTARLAPGRMPVRLALEDRSRVLSAGKAPEVPQSAGSVETRPELFSRRLTMLGQLRPQVVGSCWGRLLPYRASQRR